MKENMEVTVHESFARKLCIEMRVLFIFYVNLMYAVDYACVKSERGTLFCTGTVCIRNENLPCSANAQ